MKLGISPKRHREQLEHKLRRIDAKIASMEADIEPYRSEREMVLEMLAIHEKHHPHIQLNPGEDIPLAEQPAGEPLSSPEEVDKLPAMLKVRR